MWGGTALLVAGRLWGSACTFVALYLLARRLEPGGFGRYTFYLALFALLDALVDMGTGAVAVQRTADDESAIRGVLATARRIRLATGLLGLGLVGGGALLFGEPGAPWVLLASLYPLSHALELSATVFKNRIAWGLPVAIRALASTLSLAFVLLLLRCDAGEPALYLVGVAAGSASANFLLHAAARRHLAAVRVAAPVPWRELLGAALPLGLAGLCQQAYFYVDNLFVRAIEGEEPLGHYNVGVRVMSYAIMVAVYASMAALPWFAREHAAGRLGPAVARLARPLFALAGLGAGLCFPWTRELLGLFGPGFEQAAASLQWLLGAATVVYVGSALLTAVIATGGTRAVLAVAATGLGVNLVGNALLVPRLGIDGAALATFVTEAAVALGALFALHRAGVRNLGGGAPLLWLGGPLMFALGYLVSSPLAGLLE